MSFIKGLLLFFAAFLLLFALSAYEGSSVVSGDGNSFDKTSSHAENK